MFVDTVRYLLQTSSWSPVAFQFWASFSADLTHLSLCLSLNQTLRGPANSLFDVLSLFAWTLKHHSNGVQRKAIVKIFWSTSVTATKACLRFLQNVPQSNLEPYCFHFIFSDVPTDPEFLSGGGCYIYSSPSDSTQGRGVLRQRKKHMLLWGCYFVLLSFHSALLSYPRARSKITADSNAHTLTL